MQKRIDNKEKNANKKKIISIIFGIVTVVIIVILSMYIKMKNTVIKEGTIDGYHYTVGETKTFCKSAIEELNAYYNCEYYGYNTKVHDDKIDYTIYIGKKYTGGWNIFVRKIKKNKDGSIVIIIDEQSPKGMADQWSTTPNITITFDKKPNKVIIKNVKGKEYKFINNG